MIAVHTVLFHIRNRYPVKDPKASFILDGWPPTQTPTQKSKNEFSMSNSHEFASSLVSFQMIFQAPQSEILRSKFHFLRSKLQKIPKFNLDIKRIVISNV